MTTERFRIDVQGRPVSAVWDEAPGASAVLALAPGAGAPLNSPFLEGFATAARDLGLAVLRCNFPYQERLPRLPDALPTLLATWHAASAVARERSGDRAVAVGGKSLGGRIASMAVAAGMPADALVFLGYPLHPPGDVTKIRDAHLDAIRVPMLFLQGTRDPFARPDLLRAVIDRLGDRATLVEIPGGDHSFHRAGTPRDATAEGAALAPTVASFLLPLRRAA